MTPVPGLRHINFGPPRTRSPSAPPSGPGRSLSVPGGLLLQPIRAQIRPTSNGRPGDRARRALSGRHWSELAQSLRRISAVPIHRMYQLHAGTVLQSHVFRTSPGKPETITKAVFVMLTIITRLSYHTPSTGSPEHCPLHKHKLHIHILLDMFRARVIPPSPLVVVRPSKTPSC
ncbi:hypothetical protein FKP32DRAFT_657770 [Trametes sanguinea]|nr:hypothetical protein FKP32DRAFT_657770 [Trametes sanguinea]